MSAAEVAVLRDALFDCVGTLSNVCGGPTDRAAGSAFEALVRALDVLAATNHADMTDRSGEGWRGEAVLRLAMLRSLHPGETT